MTWYFNTIQVCNNTISVFLPRPFNVQPNFLAVIARYCVTVELQNQTICLRDSTLKTFFFLTLHRFAHRYYINNDGSMPNATLYSLYLMFCRTLLITMFCVVIFYLTMVFIHELHCYIHIKILTVQVFQIDEFKVEYKF